MTCAAILYEFAKWRSDKRSNWAKHNRGIVPAVKEDAKALGIKGGDPVLILDRVTYAKDGRPLEFVMYHYHWQRYEFSVAALCINSKLS
jgi:DNA-binding GntR family transcriptional regulator